MTRIKIIAVAIIFCLGSCGQPGPGSPHQLTQSLLNKAPLPDAEIYDFMNIVIKDQNLDRMGGLALEPQPDIDLSERDEIFLKSLLIDTTRKQKVDEASTDLFNTNISSSFGQLDKCLTRADIDFMLEQKAHHAGFAWDNARLGFNSSNTESWWVFSIPLFSKDGSKAVMMIRFLCKGLCGTGWTVLFRKENNKWISQTGNGWYH